MSDDLVRIAELSLQGFCCSQVLVILGLEAQGKTNPDLVRAMQGLCGGIGWSGGTCGILMGAACVLSLYAGRGLPEETGDWQLGVMLRDLVEWFDDEYGKVYGGIRCEEILAGSLLNRQTRCPAIMVGTWEKVKDLLLANAYELEGTER